MPRDYGAELEQEMARLGRIEQEPEKLVSTHTVLAGLREVAEGVSAARGVLPDDAPQFLTLTHLLKRMREHLHDASTEWVSTSRAAALTGWTAKTLRKHGERAVRGEPVEDRENVAPGWATLVARRESTGDFAFVLASIPAHPSRVVAGDVARLPRSA